MKHVVLNKVIQAGIIRLIATFEGLKLRPRVHRRLDLLGLVAAFEGLKQT
ncbi:MAG: hypothetical protein ACPLRU_00250 [Desulfofundulus sp.]